MAQGRSAEERAFYLRLAIRERWGTRKLERQLRTRLFERSIATPPKVSAVLTLLHPAAEAAFKDAYFLEFLDLSDGHSEADLHRGLLRNLQRFILEMGRDFAFVGSEYPLQVGGRVDDHAEVRKINRGERDRAGQFCSELLNTWTMAEPRYT
jgi:predicted nuclease of restriction endonuclease-like (RecB) superfamily